MTTLNKTNTPLKLTPAGHQLIFKSDVKPVVFVSALLGPEFAKSETSVHDFILRLNEGLDSERDSLLSAHGAIRALKLSFEAFYSDESMSNLLSAFNRNPKFHATMFETLFLSKETFAQLSSRLSKMQKVYESRLADLSAYEIIYAPAAKTLAQVGAIKTSEEKVLSELAALKTIENTLRELHKTLSERQAAETYITLINTACAYLRKADALLDLAQTSVDLRETFYIAIDRTYQLLEARGQTHAACEIPMSVHGPSPEGDWQRQHPI